MKADQSLIKGAADLAKAESSFSLASTAGAAMAGANISKAAMFIANDLEEKAKEKQAEEKQFQTWVRRAKDSIAVGGKTGIFENQIRSEAVGTRLDVDNIATDKSLSLEERESFIRAKLDKFQLNTGNYASNLQVYNNIINTAAEGNISNTSNIEAITSLVKAAGEGRVVGEPNGIHIYDTAEKTGKATIITFDELKSDKYQISQKDERLMMTYSNLAANRASKADNITELNNQVTAVAGQFTAEQKRKLILDSTTPPDKELIDTPEELELFFRDVVEAEMKLSYSPPVITNKALDPSSNQGRANRYIESAQSLEGLEGLLNEAIPGAWQRNGNIISFYTGNTKGDQPLYDSQPTDVSTSEGIKAVLKLAATTEYGAPNGSKMNDYIRQGEINGFDFSEKEISDSNNFNSNNENEIKTTNTKLDKVEKERERLNWKTTFVNNGEFDKYLENNNISKKGAINKSTGMVKSTIVNRPDFKEAFGDEYPANTYKDGSKLFGTMQSEFYGKDFLRSPGGKFTRKTRTEYEEEVKNTKKEQLDKINKKNRSDYFRASAKDLSAYDQLAKNNENIPQLPFKDFEKFIQTGELEGKFVNIILNNEDKFSKKLIDLIDNLLPNKK